MTKHSILRIFFRIIIALAIYVSCFLGNTNSIYSASTSTNTTDDLTKSTYMLNLENLSPMNTKKAPGGKEAVKVILSSASSLLLFILPIIAAISLIVAGYYYILSSGDSEKASQAKTIIKWNVIAILIALFSYAIIQLVASVLGGNI